MPATTADRPPHYVTSEAVFDHAARIRLPLDLTEVPTDDPRRDAARELVAAGNALVRELNASL
mgnify:CR=1 FL=1